MALRLSSLARVSLLVALLLFILHFLSASHTPSGATYTPYDEEEDLGWTERLGLDHYADWEAGVTGRLGNGLDNLVGGFGAIKGGLGWGVKGTKLGSLYEVSAELAGRSGERGMRLRRGGVGDATCSEYPRGSRQSNARNAPRPSKLPVATGRTHR